MPIETAVSRFFRQGGELSDTLSNFELRPGQVELVEAIETAIHNEQHLLAEAGTGIGKTFAYLLPVLAKKQQVLISTATKHLQDQVYFKDLPIVEKVLGRKVSACLLKGRGNYFCHYRFDEFAATPFGLTQTLEKKISKIRQWSEETLSGDLSEIAAFTEQDLGLKKRITSTTDNCLGGECPSFDRCFLQKVREKAKKSEVIIVNHALLMADIVLKETGFAEILPEIEVVVIDEAHHLPKVATQAFAEELYSGQLIDLAKDVMSRYQKNMLENTAFVESVERLTNSVEDFVEALGQEKNDGQINLSMLKKLNQPYRCFQNLMQAYAQFLKEIQGLAEHHEDVVPLVERADLLAQRIKRIFLSQKASDETATLLDSVALLEWSEHHFRVARLPIHLGYRFREVMEAYANSWIFVSATLSVNGSFDFFKVSLGVETNLTEITVNSPFDYQHHAAIHIAEQLPEPNHPDFIEQLVDFSQQIIQQVKGRTFMLFTSYRNLNKAADLLADSEFTLFVQGEQPKSQLIEHFIRSDNAVLLGTVSFWEGVDVSGDSLSCVIIDRIPFPSPGDPMIAEQSRYLASQGKSAFAHCYLPRAATLLKQGAGRLIRSTTDKGILVFGDVRMKRKSYGRQLIEAMPPAKMVDQKQLFTFIEQELS